MLIAFKKGQIQVFEELINRGANIDAQDCWGDTLLIDCLKNLNYNNSFEITRLFIKLAVMVK